MQNTIKEFCITEPKPNTLKVGEKVIVTAAGANKNKIFYKAHDSKNPEYLTPHEGMIIFASKENKFYAYKNAFWNQLDIENQEYNESLAVDTHFTGISEEYIPENKKYLYLYVENNTLIDLSKINLTEFTVILKQHHETVHKITWSKNILWENKAEHKLSENINATDIIRFYRLPETTHFLAKIIGQNYQF